MSLTYTDSKLRDLVEEVITQQRGEFTLNEYSYTFSTGMLSMVKWTIAIDLIESNELQLSDHERVRLILEAVIVEGRITATT